MEPLFLDLGESLLLSTRERAATQRDPEGQPWVPLDPKYRAIKAHRRPGAPMLVWDFHMLGDRLSYQADAQSVAIGTSADQGAIQQWGGRTGRKHAAILPARPYLGLSAQDRGTVLRKANRFIDLRLKGEI